MTNEPLNKVVRRLFRLAGSEKLQALSDRRLVQWYVERRDESAFEELMRRHEDMVWSVCRRSLRQDQDAEDACQAVFLMLMQQAPKIRWRESIGGWLHRAAQRTAVNAKKMQKRRCAREKRSAQMRKESIADVVGVGDLSELLDKELAHLSEKWREPLVLCYLEGLTWKQAAQRLGVSLSCLEQRLVQGREQLRQRLIRRGLNLSDLALGTLLSPGSMLRESPASLRTVVIDWLQKLTLSSNLTAAGVSAQVIQLTQKALRIYAIKTKVLLGVLVALMVAGGGAATYSGFLLLQRQERQKEGSSD